ncbi:MAG: 50S ribosomal protein L4 [Candidatus Aenigmarchaeota archaeon]|nr:50S ribosomal protein L4 [Candidatus Aenigmarchaeota archaeon]MCX8179488.1 50S ribosomal protein L4 [Candidatus Aenigmarchaeota archaeon]
MKTNVYGVDGKIKKQIDLPTLFSTPIREDVIRRAVLALQSQERQPYGTDVFAGLRTSAHYHGKRRMRYQMINRGIARLPRLHRTSPQMVFRVRRVPQAVKGRRAHPPKVEKIFAQKINKKELVLALKSAISASCDMELVKKRGHKVDGIKLPIVFEDDVQKIKKTKEFEELLKKIGLQQELERCKKKTQRPGKGKMRGRRYKVKKGPLLVVAEDNGILKAARNLPGVDAVLLKDLTVNHLAPGSHIGRITLWSLSAIKALEEKVK